MRKRSFFWQKQYFFIGIFGIKKEREKNNLEKKKAKNQEKYEEVYRHTSLR